MTGVKARVFRPTVNISLEDLVPADHFYTHHYRADVARCNACRIKAKCTTSEEGRTIRGSFFQEYLERVAAYYQTQAYKKAYRKRKVWVEPLFGEAQQWHGLDAFGYAGW
jgi:hypothetical protein